MVSTCGLIRPLSRTVRSYSPRCRQLQVPSVPDCLHSLPNLHPTTCSAGLAGPRHPHQVPKIVIGSPRRQPNGPPVPLRMDLHRHASAWTEVRWGIDLEGRRTYGTQPIMRIRFWAPRRAPWEGAQWSPMGISRTGWTLDSDSWCAVGGLLELSMDHGRHSPPVRHRAVAMRVCMHVCTDPEVCRR